MQCFSVTNVTDRRWHYFVANFPVKRQPWSRKAGGRGQKKFTTREAAEAFLAEARREWEHRREGGAGIGRGAALRRYEGEESDRGHTECELGEGSDPIDGSV